MVLKRCYEVDAPTSSPASSPPPNKRRLLFPLSSSSTFGSSSPLSRRHSLPAPPPSDSPTNPLGPKATRPVDDYTIPRAVSFSKHVALRVQVLKHASGQHADTLPYRIVQVPTNYTFAHLRKLILFLFNVPTSRAVPALPSYSSQTHSNEGYIFELQRRGVPSPDQLGVIEGGKTWAKISRVLDPLYRYLQVAKAFEEDDGHEGEDALDEEGDWRWENESEFTIENAWPTGIDAGRGIIYRHNAHTTLHITINTKPLPTRRGIGNKPYVFEAVGSIDLDEAPRLPKTLTRATRQSRALPLKKEDPEVSIARAKNAGLASPFKSPEKKNRAGNFTSKGRADRVLHPRNPFLVADANADGKKNTLEHGGKMRNPFLTASGQLKGSSSNPFVAATQVDSGTMGTLATKRWNAQDAFEKYLRDAGAVERRALASRVVVEESPSQPEWEGGAWSDDEVKILSPSYSIAPPGTSSSPYPPTPSPGKNRAGPMSNRSRKFLVERTQRRIERLKKRGLAALPVESEDEQEQVDELKEDGEGEEPEGVNELCERVYATQGRRDLRETEENEEDKLGDDDAEGEAENGGEAVFGEVPLAGLINAGVREQERDGEGENTLVAEEAEEEDETERKMKSIDLWWDNEEEI